MNIDWPSFMVGWIACGLFWLVWIVIGVYIGRFHP